MMFITIFMSCVVLTPYRSLLVRFHAIFIITFAGIEDTAQG
jgi:hypothetical protein